jgi:hypothetical protein
VYNAPDTVSLQLTAPVFFASGVFMPPKGHTADGRVIARAAQAGAMVYFCPRARFPWAGTLFRLINGSHEQNYDLGHAFWSDVSVQSQALLTSHRSWGTQVMADGTETV